MLHINAIVRLEHDMSPLVNAKKGNRLDYLEYAPPDSDWVDLPCGTSRANQSLFLFAHPVSKFLFQLQHR